MGEWATPLLEGQRGYPRIVGVLRGTQIERLRVGGGARREERVVGNLDADRQDGRVIIVVPAWSVYLVLRLSNDKRPDIDMLSIGGPHFGCIVRRIARLRQSHDKAPRERPVREALLEILREKIRTELRQRRMIDEMLRRRVLHGPAHKLTLSIGIDESERVQTVVCPVSPAVCPGHRLCPFGKGLRFGMCREEALDC